MSYRDADDGTWRAGTPFGPPHLYEDCEWFKVKVPSVFLAGHCRYVANRTETPGLTAT